MFEVPNLDDFSHEVGDQLEASRVLRILSQYCEHKAYAIQARLIGKIDVAVKWENANEVRYKLLPQWAKW